MNYIETLKLECIKLIQNAYICYKNINNKDLCLNLNDIEIFDNLLNNKNGDFYTTFAIKNAKKINLNAEQICKIIIDNINLINNKYIENVNIKNNFINFNINKKFLNNSILKIFLNKEKYGQSEPNNKNVIVEFVSANPTGQMHIGNARGGVIGDCLSEILKFSGFNVTKEFYINDAGNQVYLLGLSVFYRYKELLGKTIGLFPENGYCGEDIIDIANYLIKIYGKKFINIPENEALNEIIKIAIQYNIKNIKYDLTKYNIYYDNWFSEKSLYNNGYIKDTINILLKKNKAYEKEGTIFFKTSDECCKDDILVRNDGTYTYFASDIAYHRNKIEKRNFDKVINIWGTDHHGHIFRLKKAIDDLGLNGNQKIEIILMQLVHLISNNQKIKMSKRTGKTITLKTLLEEVPIDSVRFFFNNYNSNTHMNFDLTLAIKNDIDNPIYYIKYAYVRIISILNEIKDFNIIIEPQFINIVTPEELELTKYIIIFKNEIDIIIRLMDTSRLNKYIFALANVFHKFYSNCNIKQSSNEIVKNTRLILCHIVKNIIEKSFKILKLTLPNNM